MRTRGGGGGGGGCGGDGRGGGGGCEARGPQSPQSVPYSQPLPTAPVPPSWHTPLKLYGHTSSQMRGGDGAIGGAGGGGGGGEGAPGGGGGGGDGGGDGAMRPLPHTQQFSDGTLKSGESAHSWPGTIAPSRQWPSDAYFSHVPPNWLRHPRVSTHGAPVTEATAGATSAESEGPSAGMSLFPHAQQCLPASPQAGPSAHSWPGAKPLPVQWPSVTKLEHRALNWLVQPGVSVQAVRSAHS